SSESTLPPPKTGQKKRGPPAVHIHHKFIVIDGETDDPTIYTGSANLSNNSTHKNDENLLEIKGNPELARTYFAEFMRLYEHYRARALWNVAQGAGAKRRAKGRSKKSAAGTASALAGATLGPAQAQPSPPPGFVDQPPFANNWAKPLSEVVHIDLSAAAPELGNEAVRERHRIYCHLLMKLMVRFWNGNK